MANSTTRVFPCHFIPKTGKWEIMVMVSILFQLISFLLTGQTTIKGRVTDAQTYEPVVFAHIVFKGTFIGTVTDFTGNFTLSGKSENDSLVISLIGYNSRTVGIGRDSFQILDISLDPAMYSIQEIRVIPGENPAHRLLKNVWKNKESNSMEKLSSYQYENYSRSTIFLRKFNPKKSQKRSSGMFSKEYDKYGVKTGDDEIPAIPSFINETLSDNYFLQSPARNFTHIKATYSNGLAFENSDLVAQLINKQENFYFPDNTIPIINKSFISPLSRFGLLFYRYYLVDSLVIDNKYFCYQVDVVPKREEDPVFFGTMWINDTTYALKRISVEVSQKAEINFIRRIKIQQDYEPVDSGAWFPVKTRFMADAVNVFVNNFSQKSKFVITRPSKIGFYGSEIKVSLNSRDHGQDYWDSHRMNSFDHTDSLALWRINQLKTNSKVRVSAKHVEASVKGYYNFGKFEGGPWLMMYNHNKVEGNRFRIGGRTNLAFSKKLILEGYLAYGTRDKHVKGSFQSEFFLSKEHWTKIGVQFRDDIENTGSLDEFYSPSTFLTFATTFGGSDKMNRSVVHRSWFESDLFNGMNGKVIITHKTFDPVSPDFIFAWFTNPQKTSISESYSFSEIACILRYQPKATYILDGVRRFPMNFNKYPVLSLEYFRGMKRVLKSDFDYHKIVADIFHSFNVGGIGAFEYDVSFTKIFGQLPYPMLVTLAGNQTFFRTNRTYNLMNYGEFILDEALELFISYHMDGLILNKIPLLKKLQWRTVVSAHGAIGSFNHDKNGFYDPFSHPKGILPDTIGGHPASRFNTLTYQKPYLELSYGIENIFKFLRIDLVHRLNWLENANSNRFGIKISGVFRF